MLKNKEYLIKLLINDINNEIIDIKNNYDNNTVQFNINDTVYYFDNNKIIKGKIVDIDDFTKNGEIQTGLVYYWVTPKSIFTRLFEKIKYFYCSHFNKQYIPSPQFFTHSVLFGSDIFKTEDEAIKANILYNSRFYLYELLEMDI